MKCVPIVKDALIKGFELAPGTENRLQAFLDEGANWPLMDMLEVVQNLNRFKDLHIHIFEFCPIHAGTFRMESNEVKLGQDFYLGKYPVTQQQWDTVMGNNPSSFRGGSLPVETVSWDDVQNFIQILNTKSGKNVYRLPTEAEWEYACRAGSTSVYYFGNDESQLGEYAWYDGNSGQTTHPVGQKKPNGWGLYDMYGNVWEWTDSWYDSSCFRAM